MPINIVNRYKKVDRVIKSKINYAVSLYKSSNNLESYANIQNFCMFIGNPRSGHTLIAALLDAHKNAVIDTNELNIIDLVKKGYSQQQIYYLIHENSKKFAVSGKQKTGYSYDVPYQWQGKHQDIKVIGGDHIASVMELSSNNQLLAALENEIRIAIKFIFVIRNPFDSITTMYLRNKLNLDLDNRIEYYFSVCQAISDFSKKISPNKILQIKHEDFVDTPQDSLKKITKYLEIKAEDDYINNCSSIIHKSCNKTRNKIDWDSNRINIVQTNIEKFDFLKGYLYEK